MLQVAAHAELRTSLVTDLVAMLHTPVGVDGDGQGNADELVLIEQVLLSEAKEVARLAGQGVPDGVPDIGCIYEALWQAERYPRAHERV